MRRGELVERLAAVVRLPRLGIEYPHRFRVARVGDDVVVVPGARPQVALLGLSLPGVTTVVGSKDGAIFGLDDGVQPIDLGTRSTDADLAQRAFGQAFVARDLGPGIARVDGLEQTAVRAAAGQARRIAASLPEGGV